MIYDTRTHVGLRGYGTVSNWIELHLLRCTLSLGIFLAPLHLIIPLWMRLTPFRRSV